MPTYPAPHQLRLANVTSDIIPSANVTYDLGNTTNSWGSLFLAGNTISIAGATISVDANSGYVVMVPVPTEAEANPKATVISSNGVATVETTAGVANLTQVAAASSNTVSAGGGGGGGGVSTFVASFKSPTNAQIYVANNVGDGHGLYFRSNVTIDYVQLTVSEAPQGANVVVAMKKGNTYSTSASVNTFTLEANSINSTELAANVAVTGGESIFYDITATGSSTRGSGLNIRTIYTTG